MQDIYNAQNLVEEAAENLGYTVERANRTKIPASPINPVPELQLDFVVETDDYFAGVTARYDPANFYLEAMDGEKAAKLSAQNSLISTHSRNSDSEKEFHQPLAKDTIEETSRLLDGVPRPEKIDEPDQFRIDYSLS